MEFNLLKNTVSNIQRTIENTAIVAVNALKAHVFGVKVKNFPKNQKVSGVVSVSNQKRLESELKKSTTIQKTMLEWLKGLKFPTSIKVDNFPEYPEYPEFPNKMEITNFPKLVEPPKNIRISNQPTKELKDIAKQVKALQKSLAKLKLDPKINVEAPKPDKITVQAPDVMVTQQEIDYEKLAGLIPVAETINYEKLADTIANKVAEMAVTVGGGGGGGGRKEGFDDITREYNISDKDVADTTKYYGFIGKAGKWYILKENTTTNEYRYVKGSSNYTTNWTGRDGLTYGYYNEVF